MEKVKVRNTLDLDRITKDQLQHILSKICRCPSLAYYILADSWAKGYHVTLWCLKDCDLCRFHYDDQRRYYADLTNREPHERNILWTRKSYYPSLSKLLDKIAHIAPSPNSSCD